VADGPCSASRVAPYVVCRASAGRWWGGETPNARRRPVEAGVGVRVSERLG
jgi:hypothetical protein